LAWNGGENMYVQGGEGRGRSGFVYGLRPIAGKQKLAINGDE